MEYDDRNANELEATPRTINLSRVRHTPAASIVVSFQGQTPAAVT